jgi:hypothetical protein
MYVRTLSIYKYLHEHTKALFTHVYEHNKHVYEHNKHVYKHSLERNEHLYEHNKRIVYTHLYEHIGRGGPVSPSCLAWGLALWTTPWGLLLLISEQYSTV